MNKKLWIYVAMAVGLIVIGYFVFIVRPGVRTEEAIPVFVSEEECEKTKGEECGFRTCDYVPPGKTFEEVCGKNFKKGWYSLSYKSISQVTQGSSREVGLDTSNWKTYRNEKYRFEFLYPPDWTAKDHGNEITISPSIKDQPIIYISVSLAQNDQHLSLDCPITTHQIECKNLKNPSGIKYTRSISTGQLELYKQQQLDGFFQSPNFDLQMTVFLTDKNGNPDSLAPQTIRVFDQILSTFKFTK